jgi:hypothetical protein
MQKLTLLRILWPSFLVGGAAETVFFTFFDPMDLTLFGEPVAWSRTAVYSIGFFLFWVFAAASSWLTLYLQRAADEVNVHPLPGTARPPGFPSRDEAAGE